MRRTLFLVALFMLVAALPAPGHADSTSSEKYVAVVILSCPEEPLPDEADAGAERAPAGPHDVIPQAIYTYSTTMSSFTYVVNDALFADPSTLVCIYLDGELVGGTNGSGQGTITGSADRIEIWVQAAAVDTGALRYSGGTTGTVSVSAS